MTLPDLITIVPDDYHTPYAGLAADGRQFFVTDELFDVTGPGELTGYVATFLWHPNGEFDELRVDKVTRPAGYPPGQPVPARSEALIAHLAALGQHTLQPITVAPFRATREGVEFGFVPRDEDGVAIVDLQPGFVIAYYEPFNGLEYDT
jgi:hypothetical protein